MKDYLYKKKLGEFKSIYCLFHVYHQTFPVNKIVLKTKVLTAYYIFQFSTGSGVIRNAHCSMISLLQGKYVLKILCCNLFSTTDNLNSKSSFKSTEHIQKKKHGPSSDYQFRAVCIQSKETMNLSLNKYFILFYSLSLLP